jgi:hypothetical protein
MLKTLGLLVLAAAAAPAAKAPPAKAQAPAAKAPAAKGKTMEAGGVAWTVPAAWTEEGPRPMRVATYKIAAAPGDKEGAELGVFYFGAGQGGGVQANVDRWLGQFKKPDGSPAAPTAKVEKRTVNGIPMTGVDVKGTYAGAGAMMGGGAGAAKPDYRMMAAIAEGPDGAVFFKLTGPEKTVGSVEKDFTGLITSLRLTK